MEHGIEPPKARTLEELGVELGKLRYDAIEQVLLSFANEIAEQSEADKEKGYHTLSCLGERLSDRLYQAMGVSSRMFRVSSRHMKEDLLNRPRVTREM